MLNAPDTNLHVRADAEQQAEVHAQRADVGARLALDPEDAEVARLVVLEQLGLVDRAHAQLALDGRDQRRALRKKSGKIVCARQCKCVRLSSSTNRASLEK